MLCHIIESFKNNNANTAKEIKWPRQDLKYLCSSFQEFFLMWTIFKVFIEFATILSVLCFWLSGKEACGILVPWSGIEPIPPVLEGKIFHHWTAGEDPLCSSFYPSIYFTKDLQSKYCALKSGEIDPSSSVWLWCY